MTSGILVVEDDVSVRELVGLILGQAGYSVTMARTGEVALETLQYAKPALILLDIGMPGMSGVQVLKHIRQSRRLTIPVLMMTANQSPETVRDVLAMGGNDYFLKPFTPELLLQRVRKALASRPIDRPRGSEPIILSA